MPKTNSKKKPMAKKQGLVIGAIILLAVILITGIFVFGKSKDKPKDMPTTTVTQTTTEVPTTQVKPVKLINPLTGLEGMDANAVGKRPVAVVVENSPAARPQWGLCSPDIVIEGVVEGGITRMLWLYADVNAIPKVGPVRSARHDFVEMAEGLDAIFVHWGWSYLAEGAINARKTDHINGLNGKYFFRDTSRGVASEHTGYTNGEAIAKAIPDLNIRQTIDATYAEPFKFPAPGTMTTPAGGSCEKISIQFSSAYKHDFKYDAGDKLYGNYLNAKPMIEYGGKHMSVTNVIVLYCTVQPTGPVLMEMDLTGGKGVFASNGAYEEITWTKSNTPSAMLKLYAANGSELVLNTGKSYIGFVPAAQSGNTVVQGDTAATP